MCVPPDGPDVRVVGPDERDTRTGQTPGLQRFEALSNRLTGSQRMWHLLAERSDPVVGG